jgi:hypothetical protein
MTSRRRSSRRRSSRRRLKGGGWNQIINQGIAPIALLGLSYAFSKRSDRKRSVKRSDRKRSVKRSERKRSVKRSEKRNKTRRR